MLAIFHFAYSFFCVPANDVVVATTAGEIIAVMSNDSETVFGVQFHTEKFSKKGLQITKNFVKICNEIYIFFFFLLCFQTPQLIYPTHSSHINFPFLPSALCSHIQAFCECFRLCFRFCDEESDVLARVNACVQREVECLCESLLEQCSYCRFCRIIDA